jgi:hypothetical protein
MQNKLRNVLPTEFFQGEFNNSPANSHLERIVIKEHIHGGWKGKHKNVYCWWELDNGILVGWNENPSKGWSFVTMRKVK